LLTLILVPVLYRLVEGRKERSAARRQAKREAKYGTAAAVGAHAPVPADGEPAAVDAESDTLLSKARKTAQRVQSSDADLINP
ncbi:hypothetical protein KZ294_27440, partial [Escherichia coli]|nr:hypothetical protein [Escherichia coli]